MRKSTTSHIETGARSGSLISYCIGFVYSLVLTLTSYILVVNHIISGGVLIAAISILAVAQLLVQLIFFLHLDKESKPFWNLQVLLLAVTTVFIVVFGSVWIMNNLKYPTVSPPGTDQNIMRDEGIFKN